MRIQSASIQVWREEDEGNELTFDTNCSWVNIKRDGQLIYKRAADNGPWYDESHRAIVTALESLEKAIEEAARNG